MPLPLHLSSVRVPSTVPAGRIAGTPVENGTSNHTVTASGNEGGLEEFIIETILSPDFDLDGWPDSIESVCISNSTNPKSVPSDTDNDGHCNHLDYDDDNDGFVDDEDEFPLDYKEWRDDDRDGIGSNADSFEFTEPIFGAIITEGALFILLVLEVLEIMAARGEISDGISIHEQE
jgi:hypothetical protein